ncbi:MAG TPA: aldehyde dehydrogenase family protein [Anaeromyxobacter sp.]
MTPAAAANPSEAPPATDRRRLDEAVARVREAARGWALAPLPEKAALARDLLAGAGRNAERMVRAACAAKGLAFDTPPAGDEWLAGVYPAVRLLRQLAESLDALAARGTTPLGAFGETDDGRTTARVFPASRLDPLLFPFVRGEVHFLAGVGRREVDETRGAFHRRPSHDGRVCLVLGAGNVNSIAPMDVATKLFIEGKACVLKMNPVNAYAGPILEDAFAPAIRRGALTIVYGGRDEGDYLAHHPGIDEVHLTGSNATHDAIVWGPPGPEREARKARREPLLEKPITSELGDISPVLVAPGPWDERTLAFQAEGVAGAMAQNGSFNCLAARVLVLPRGWRHRERFLALVERALGATPPRPAWYPGALDRLARLVEGRAEVRRVTGAEGTAPWTLVTGLDPAVADRAFTTEFFCPALVETEVGSDDPVEFLDAAVAFANERVWGTLGAAILAPAPVVSDPVTGAAVRRAVRRLHYGTVAVNCFTGYGYALASMPWGGFPGQPLDDVKSGRGFVHNSRMLEGVEKSVIWHPATHPLKPPYFPSHRTTHRMGPPLVRLEARRDLLALGPLVAAALRG